LSPATLAKPPSGSCAPPAQSQHIVPSLTASTLSALKWNYAGSGAQVLSQMAVSIVLARLLGPVPFGLVAVAWLVIGLCNLIADFGLSAALVQRRNLTELEIREAFTLQMLAGLMLALAMFALSGPTSRFFRQPEVAPVLRWFSLVFIVQAFGQTSASLLKRGMDFRSLQIAQVSSYLLAYLALGIPAALFGAAVWSLVLAQISQKALFSAQVFLRVRHPIAPRISLNVRPLAGFGWKVMFTNVLNWSIISVDAIAVGRAFGAQILGLYDRASTLVETPVNSIVPVLQGVLFAAYSRGQDKPDALKRAYLGTVSLVSMVVAPVFWGVAAAAQPAILGLYGDKWTGAIPIFVPLALAMPFYAVMGLAGPLLWGTDRVQIELRVEATVAVFMVVLVMAASTVSAVWVAWAILCVNVLRCLAMTGALSHQRAYPLEEVFRSIRGALVAGVCSWSVVSAVDMGLARTSLAMFPRFAIEAVVAGLGCLLSIRLAPHFFLPPALALVVRRVLNEVPDRWGYPLRAALVWAGLNPWLYSAQE
jgi:lipopolysaccharide exporter